MRLTEDEVRRGFKHSDKYVRFAALDYFARSHSRNTAIMGDVIEVIERLGVRNAFTYSHPMADLAQTEHSIAWVLERLRHDPETEHEQDFAAHLARLLCRADPVLLLPHSEAVLSVPALEESSVRRLTRRFELAAMPADQLWARLEAICEGERKQAYPRNVLFGEAMDVADTLARHVSQADRMMQGLAVEIDPEGDFYLGWLEIFLIRMAGEMRYEPATGLLVKKLHVDGGLHNEQCVEALIKIGTDTVVQAVRDAYRQAPDYFRLYASGIFGEVHTDLAVSAGLELLAWEPDFNQRMWLAVKLQGQFSSEVVDAARALPLDGHGDSYDLKVDLVAACKLMEYEVPELKRWEREIAEPRRPVAAKRLPASALKALDAGLRGSAPAAGRKVGRNDPCPCGSGKKYKKCCLNQSEARV